MIMWTRKGVHFFFGRKVIIFDSTFLSRCHGKRGRVENRRYVIYLDITLNAVHRLFQWVFILWGSFGFVLRTESLDMYEGYWHAALFARCGIYISVTEVPRKSRRWRTIVHGVFVRMGINKRMANGTGHMSRYDTAAGTLLACSWRILSERIWGDMKANGEKPVRQTSQFRKRKKERIRKMIIVVSNRSQNLSRWTSCERK